MADVTLNTDPPARSSRFWWGFGGGWAAYAALIVVAESAVSGEPRGWTGVAIALTVVVPPVLNSLVIALGRHRLLRPDWGVGRTVGVHVLVGVLFSLSSSVMALLATRLTGLRAQEMEAASIPGQLAFSMLTYGFLYVIFFGFLIWSESIRRVQESQRIAANEAVLRAEAEAKAVRAQFNPHFVFNTLHSLILLVRADPAAAERAIEDVATLIRYASIVQRNDLDAVPLTKELEVARRYVTLEQLRLQDRLSVQWQVDADPAHFTVPAFALQTLVENAIKHGIEPKAEGGEVCIAVRHEAGTLHVSVTDDGEGADSGALDASPSHGLGLLRRRLAARYGSAAALEWTTAPGKGFAVTLSLPAEKPGEARELAAIEVRHAPEAPGAALHARAETEDLVNR